MPTHKHNFKKICNTVEQPDHSLNVYFECNVGYCQSVKKQAFVPQGESKVIEIPGREV